MKRVFGWTIVVCAALAMVGCGDKGPGNARAQEIKDPYPAKVVKKDLVGYSFLQDPLLYIPPESQAVVYPKYKAPVEQVMVEVGQAVNRGETLIQLSMPSADAAYEQARLDVQTAESAYENARNEYSAPVREARRALDDARSIERKAREQAKLTGDASAAEQARMQREAAEQAVAEADRAVGSNLDVYKQQLDAARDAVEQAKRGVRTGSIKSPITGTVTYLNVRAGQVVGEDAREVLVKVMNLGQIQIKAYVPTDFSANMDKGKEVTVAFVELPSRVFTGRISKVSVVPTKDGGSAKELTIDFRNDKGLIKEGFTPDWAGIKVGEVKGVLAVPKEAVDVDPTGKPIVNVMENDKWVPRVVETGIGDGKFTEIKSGLKEGETVQVTPADRVK